MVQKQVTAQGWLMSTPEGDAPDPTLTRWGLAGCRQLDPPAIPLLSLTKIRVLNPA